MESLLLIALLHKRNLEQRWQKQKERCVMSRNRHTHYQTLSKEDCCCCGMKVLQIVLLPLAVSAFVRLFWLGDDPTLIRLTEFDHGLFCTILEMYTPVIDHMTVD